MIDKLVRTLVNTRKPLKLACVENGIEYSLFDQYEELQKRIDQCSICNHWRYIKSMEHDSDGFPTCQTCIEVYDL